ncbi:hypothetical protein FHS89_001882 [Rubricella aquisinus]|uniref:DUF2393 domain-containing protein n=1 Tax=Rubricella aquisinus TaxID=2028108 RepID=A0A840WQB5_9RHOB|nr:hypothetical protein [Rubricella aquisinus]MBB5515862.1 hypothetical protein [Rubricella aquisinus]
MHILLGLLALTIVLAAMVQRPRLRVPGAVFLGAVGIAAVVTFQINPRYDLPDLSADQIVLSDIVFEQDPRLTTVTGRVSNLSEEAILARFTLDTRLLDCPEATVSAACVVIGEDRTAVYPDVPPGQVRGFTATLRFVNLPPIAGVLVWDAQLAEVSARSPAQPR